MDSFLGLGREGHGNDGCGYMGPSASAFTTNPPPFRPINRKTPSPASPVHPFSRAPISFPPSPLSPPETSIPKIKSLPPTNPTIMPRAQRADEPVDEPMAVPKQEQQSPYDQVKALVQEIKAGDITKYLSERRTFEIPHADWLKLCTEFDLDEDETFPRCEYDTSRSVLTFLEMASPIHESVVDFLSRCFELKISSVDSVRVTRQCQRMTERDYDGSEKVPDLVIREKSKKRATKWVLEVGFSEDKKLQHDMRLWLRGDSKVIQCVLVKIVEDPEYKCPLPTDMTDEEIEKQGLKKEVDEDDFDNGGEYGPIFHTTHQHQWVGNIREINMEVWKLDETGEPEQVGTRRVIHPIPTDHPIQLDDILPDSILSEFSGLSDRAESLLIDWHEFAERLEESLFEMACLRYCRWWKKCEDARGENQGNQKEDPDYADGGEVTGEEAKKKRRTKRRKLNYSYVASASNTTALR